MADFLYFNSASAGDTHLLSNLNFAPVTVTKADVTTDWLVVNPDVASFIGDRTLTAPTIEHVWHSLKATDESTFLEFYDDGRFAEFDVPAFRQFFPNGDEAQK